MDESLREPIQLKLAYLNDTIERLRPRVSLPFEEYRRSEDRCLAVERLSQVAVQAATDACELVLEAEGEFSPSTTRAALELANNKGMISGPTWAVLDGYIKIRNEIVHEYDLLTTDYVYKEARGFVEKLPDFIGEVQAYLDAQGEKQH